MARNGFETVYSRHLADWSADGTLYRHERTGMEVFHVDTSDSEYFLSYSFRTLPYDSTGVFHILEHTILSGSDRYPVKDPFSLLDAHSCNSYMNALTCPDRTLYPAASPVRRDFDNILDLYTDSVMRPLLRRQDFESEGIRVGRNGFEGVVFNEMRGDAWQKDSVVASRCRRDLFEGSPYFFSSGGDVVKMCSLTYEDYLAAYRRFYCPANCRLFVYGRDLDVQAILDRLDGMYLSSMEAGEAVGDPALPPRWTSPRHESAAFQATGADDRGEFVVSFLTSSRSWKGYDNIFVSVLVDALLGGPSNPLYSALLECRLGEDLSEQSGMSADFDQIPFSVGLNGVEEKDVPALESFIMDTVAEIARDGIGEDIVEAAVRRQEFLLQEVSGGIPNGLRMFFKCIRGWERGLDIAQVLDSRSRLVELRRHLEDDGRLFEKWMQTELLDNPHRLSLYVRPEAELARCDEALIDEAWQRRKGEWHDVSDVHDERTIDMPRLGLDDIREEEAAIHVEHAAPGILFEAEETCGITYINHVVDLSDLDPDDLVYAIVLSRFILMAGTARRDAASFHGRLRLESGGYYAYLETGRAVDGHVKAFFVVTIKCLTSRTASCLELLDEWVHHLRCRDEAGVRDAINDILGDYASYIEESGSSFASSLAQASLTPSCSLGEKLMGIGCWHSLAGMSTARCIEGLERLMSLFSNRRRVTVHLCSRQEDRDEVVQAARSFLATCEVDTSVALRRTRMIEEGSRRIRYDLPSSVAYNALAFRSSPFLTREQEAESIYAQICSSTRLWEIARMGGGAYGAEASVDGMEETFVVTTYRDPHVAGGFDGMRRAMEETVLTQEALDNCRLIRLGRLLKPLSPAQKATLSLRRHMYGIDDDMRRLRRQYLKSMTLEEVLAAKDRFLSRLDDASLATLCSRQLFSKEGIEGMESRSLPS